MPHSQINSQLQPSKIYTSQYWDIYWICEESINNPLIMSCLLEEETESNSVLPMVRNQTPATLQLVQIYYWKCFHIFKISHAVLNHKIYKKSHWSIRGVQTVQQHIILQKSWSWKQDYASVTSVKIETGLSFYFAPVDSIISEM